jgi:hypothetical protein
MPGFFPGGDRLFKGARDIGVAQPFQFLPVTAPERLQHHPVRGLSPVHELGNVERAVRRDQGANARLAPCGNQAVGKPDRIAMAIVNRAGLQHRDLGALIRRTGGRLLLMARPLAENGIEPQRQKAGDEGEDDDYIHGARHPLV